MSESAFLKQFAKDELNSKDKRDHVAQEIRAARKTERAAKQELPAARTEFEKNQEKLREYVRMFEELSSQIEQSRSRLEALQTQAFGAIKNFLEIQKIRRKIMQGERSLAESQLRLEDIQKMVQTGETDLQMLEKQLGDPDHILKSYYDQIKQQWTETPVHPEDIRKYFSAEHLASLNMENYILLLKRFPSEMVTHVSRRGVRDHAGMMYHTGGLNEVQNSFDRLLESRELRGALSMKLEEDNRDEYVSRLLQLNKMTNREDALKELDYKMKEPGWNSLADDSAVHVATEYAADTFYGSEGKNEVFIAFPSALIASEYVFSGSLEHAVPGNQVSNDTWIWMKEQEGIPLDAGIVFLPSDSKVDPRTGSLYQIENGKPVVDQDRLTRVLELVKNRSLAQIVSAHQEQAYRNPFAGTIEVRNSLAEQFGVEEKSMQDFLLNGNVVAITLRSFPDIQGFSSSFSKLSDDKQADKIQEDVMNELQSQKLYFKKATETVTAEEYWDQYFTKHPERRPKHTVFYDGGDPTAGLMKWREDNELSGRTKESGISFDALKQPEQHPGGDSRDISATNRFYEIAYRLIDEKFPENVFDKPPEDTDDEESPAMSFEEGMQRWHDSAA